MNMDMAQFLEAVSADSVCGEDLIYDPLFSELERERKGKPERQTGDSIIAAEEPDWKSIAELGLQLLQRSRDIRIAVILTCAWTHTRGFAGAAQGLQLINGLLQTFWQDVHPVQDPEDDYPITRMNALTALIDFDSFLGPLRVIPLTDSRGMGNFSLRDIELAENKISPTEDEEVPSEPMIQAAFQDSEPQHLLQTDEQIQQALSHVRAMNGFLQDKVGAVNAPDFGKLITLLQNLHRLMAENIPEQETGADFDAGESQPATTEQTAVTGKPSPTSGINNREDVSRAIDEICRYFNKHEPSSPIPFLLKRAKRLLHMDFMEILQDLSPDAINQAEHICGTGEDAK